MSRARNEAHTGRKVDAPRAYRRAKQHARHRRAAIKRRRAFSARIQREARPERQT